MASGHGGRHLCVTAGFKPKRKGSQVEEIKIRENRTENAGRCSRTQIAMVPAAGAIEGSGWTVMAGHIFFRSCVVLSYQNLCAQ